MDFVLGACMQMQGTLVCYIAYSVFIQVCCFHPSELCAVDLNWESKSIGFNIINSIHLDVELNLSKIPTPNHLRSTNYMLKYYIFVYVLRLKPVSTISISSISTVAYSACRCACTYVSRLVCVHHRITIICRARETAYIHFCVCQSNNCEARSCVTVMCTIAYIHLLFNIPHSLEYNCTWCVSAYLYAIGVLHT